MSKACSIVLPWRLEVLEPFGRAKDLDVESVYWLEVPLVGSLVRNCRIGDR